MLAYKKPAIAATVTGFSKSTCIFPKDNQVLLLYHHISENHI